MIFGVRVIEKIEQGIYVFLEPLQCIQNKCDIESRIEFTVTKLVSLEIYMEWKYHKVFEKCPKNAGKIIFPIRFVVWFESYVMENKKLL